MANIQRGGSRWLGAFLAAQHVPTGSRLSTWFHGESVMDRHDRRPRARSRGPASEKDLEALPASRFHPEDYTPGLRSPSSTRSIIDPIQSPVNFSRPLHSDGSYSLSDVQDRDTHPAFDSPILIEPPYKRKRGHHHGRAFENSREAPRHTFFRSQDPQVRRKSIGTLVTGTLLVIVLTTYLAVATSNAVSTTTFHAVFIFFILLLTMIFAHFLIRLCMVTVRTQRRSCLRKRRPPIHTYTPNDLEASLSPVHMEASQRLSRSPLRFIRIRREESIHEDNNTVSDETVALPPPAYGWWRGSVRIDPEDLRYQHVDHSELQQQTRSLVFAGTGHAPPSYTSDQVEGEPARPAPLFTSERVIARQEVRDV